MRLSFAGFVFCSTEQFVFVAQGQTGQQSALLSGLRSRLVVVVDALALGFNPPWSNLSPAAAHYCAVEVLGSLYEPWESQEGFSAHYKLSNPVTSAASPGTHG